MATLVSGSDIQRIDGAESTTGWVSWDGGGAGPQDEPDAFYQGLQAVSRKGDADGLGYTGTTGVDMTSTGRRVYFAKDILTNYGSVTNMELRIGTNITNYYYYVIANNSDIPYPAKGGFLITAVNPNISSHTSSAVGTYTVSNTGAWGLYVDCGVSRAENIVVDAIDIGTGLFLYGGGGADPVATFDNFVELDEDNINNRFGVVTTSEGIIFCVGRLIIGASSSLDSKTTQITTFEDSGKTIIFPDGFVEPGDIGIDCDISSSSTTISMSSCNFLGRGREAVGSVPDTRPIFEVYGSSGKLLVDSSTFNNFNYIVLSSSNCIIDSCTISDTNSITQSSAIFDSCTFTNHTTVESQSFILSDNPALITNCNFSNNGSGHALELTTTGTFNFLGNTFVGYSSLNEDGNSTFYNTSGGVITMSIQAGGSGDVTYRNSGSSTTLIESSLSITLTGLASFDPGTGVEYTEVRVLSAGTNNEIAGIEEATTGEFTFGVSSGQSVDIVIHNLYYVYQRINNYSTTEDVTIPIQQTFDRNYNNP